MTITVTDLIKDLSELDGDLIVVQSKDAEGNSYSPLAGIAVGKYEAESTWSGEFWDGEPYAEEGTDAVCLWPVN